LCCSNWRLHRREQNVFLLPSRATLYGWWDWRFLALMIGSTTIDFLVAQKINPSRSDTNRKNGSSLVVVEFFHSGNIQIL